MRVAENGGLSQQIAGVTFAEGLSSENGGWLCGRTGNIRMVQKTTALEEMCLTRRSPVASCRLPVAGWVVSLKLIESENWKKGCTDCCHCVRIILIIRFLVTSSMYHCCI